MFNFIIETSVAFQSVILERVLFFRFAGILRRIFFMLFIGVAFVFLYGFLSERFSPEILALLLGVAVILLSAGLFFLILDLFYNLKVKRPRFRPAVVVKSFDKKIESSVGKITKEDMINEAVSDPERFNLADFLDFDATRAAWRALKFAKARGIAEINSGMLFYFLLEGNQKLNFVFSRALLNINDIKKALRSYFDVYLPKQDIVKPIGDTEVNYSNDFQAVIYEALRTARKKGHSCINVGDLIIALSKEDPFFKNILVDTKLNVDDIENLIWWLERLEKKIDENKRFWEWKNLMKEGTLAKEWTAGYTNMLDKFSIDFSEVIRRQRFPEMIGHEEEIKSIERILSRREINNVLMVGEQGSGRKSMTYALARRSVLGEGSPEINFKRIVQLDMLSILAQAESTEEVESILDNIFSETVSAGNIVLIIDEFHNFIGTAGGSRPGITDISGVISSYLHLPQFQIIAITTFEGLHKNIEKNSSILALFEKVEVSEVSEKETLLILENLSLSLERKYKVMVTFPALRDIIVYCKKYMAGSVFPEKALDLLDESMIHVSQKRERILLPKHVARIVSEKTQIPVGEMETKEKKILLNLEQLIHQRIINQEEAVGDISSALRRARAGLKVRKGPIGSFLFLGPTGVGKTETSKALSEIYFGSEEKMIRIDMSEFQNLSDISRLIGSAAEEGMLTTPVKENPFSLILLDEFEKAHPNVLNLFLQVLDEGNLTDGLGRKISFLDTIIIVTSNAGYEIILDALKAKSNWSKVKENLLDFIFKKGIFRPELINRFDGVIVFKPLTKENLFDISGLLLAKLANDLKEKGIKLIVTDALKEKIVKISYNPTFGARNMQRVIQDKVSNVLATAILSEKIIRGDTVEINPLDFTLIIN